MSDNDQLMQFPKPNPALKRLDVLVGKWKITGRTEGSEEDNITGDVTYEWLPGGFFLLQTGNLNFNGMVDVKGYELFGYDEETDSFKSWSFSNLFGAPANYMYQLKDGKMTIDDGNMADYTGTVTKDEMKGSWTPKPGHENDPGNIAYETTTTRVK